MFAAAMERQPGESMTPEREEATRRIETELAEVAGLLNATTGWLVSLIADGLANDVWAQSGVHSPEQWVAWNCGLSAGRARQLVALARRLEDLPVCREALEAGELAIDQAIVMAHHAPAWADREVTEFAKQVTVSQLGRHLRRYAFDPANDHTDDDASDNADKKEAEASTESGDAAAGEIPGDEPASGQAGDASPKRLWPPMVEEHRVVRFGAVEDRWRAFIDLPLDEGAAFETALVAARDDLFHQRHPDAHEDEVAQPCDVCWADALGLVAERSLAGGERERSWTERYQVLFHYDLDPVGHPVLGPHGLPALPDCLRRYWLCDGTVKPVTEVAGSPVNVGRQQHIVPRRLRRLIEHRDGGCRVPGCDRSRWLQIHHIVHWEDDGPTDSWNLVALCAHHHRIHHLGMLGISGNADDPDGLVFTDQRKRLLAGAGRPAPPGHPPRQAAQHLGLHVGDWQRPTGESLQPGALHFNPPSLN